MGGSQSMKSGLIGLLVLGFGIGLAWHIGRDAGRAEQASASIDAPMRVAGQTERGELLGVSEIVKIADPVERAERFLALVRSLDAHQFPEVASQLQGQSDEWAEFEARLFIWAWSTLDPAAAMEASLQWSPNLRDSVGYAAARAWARRDPIAAREAVRLELEAQTTERATLDTSLMSGLAHGWAENGDFEGALTFIDDRFPALAHRETLVEMLVQQMLDAKGVAATFAWAESLAARHDDRAFLSIVFRKVGRNAIRIDPAATSAWLDRFEGDPSYMNRARRAAAVAWGREDPRAALGWMLAQPPTNVRRVSGLTVILVDWVVREEAAARDWVRVTPPDPGLDEGVALAARKIAERSPSDALEWVELVRDPARREEALVSVGARWWRADEKAVSRWIEMEKLSPAVETRIVAAAAALPPVSPNAAAQATIARP